MRLTVSLFGWLLLALGALPFAPNGARADALAGPKGSPPRTEPDETEPGVLVTRVYPVSADGSTRVVVGLTGAVSYKSDTLPADPAKGLAQRFYTDLIGARVARVAAGSFAVDDSCIQQIRVAQFSARVVRVVLDLKDDCPSRAVFFKEGSRLVIEVKNREPPSAPPGVASAKATTRPKPAARQIPGIRKIVLDPGHGGKDTGAIGHGGLMEKDVVLAIAKKLARRLRNELGVEVTLTREDDSFVQLEERTAIANREGADLFISLHTNASPNPQARGVETYYLNNTDDEAAKRLAARENATSTKNISDIQFILSDLIQNSKLEDSISLAHHLQAAMVDHAGKKLGEVKDLGVKQALFFVLVGAKMPSVLAEIFFITNREDARWLARDAYQESIVDGLFEGIKAYCQRSLANKSL
ncbi:MAG TPA: N-acetylmuramoyl-L-alanine amidase [Candidatus Acidoferrales bacterium]|nr:N-acetylmuramoyl-L-alanine amidase [Candidatus Acidoferrales bacterium]